ncbi:hypothetical protein AGLY_000840 [Aphis glycines]|uniref:Uncharacterized protein n=1 Tax=Aphis glycines TaxID=307491 RepID=A0A6G0U8L8_APHGL|nr:hypothetical protein AGLY_000840 [Aphis glycines]
MKTRFSPESLQTYSCKKTYCQIFLIYINLLNLALTKLFSSASCERTLLTMRRLESKRCDCITINYDKLYYPSTNDENNTIPNTGKCQVRYNQYYSCTYCSCDCTLSGESVVHIMCFLCVHCTKQCDLDGLASVLSIFFLLIFPIDEISSTSFCMRGNSFLLFVNHFFLISRSWFVQAYLIRDSTGHGVRLGHTACY